MFCKILTDNLEEYDVTFNEATLSFYKGYRCWGVNDVLAVYDWDNDAYVKCSCGSVIENKRNRIDEHLKWHREMECNRCIHRYRRGIYHGVAICSATNPRRAIDEISAQEKEEFCPHRLALSTPFVPYKPRILEVDADFTSKLPTVFGMSKWKLGSRRHDWQCVGLACLKAKVVHGVVCRFDYNGIRIRYDSKHDVIYDSNMDVIPETATFYYRGHDHTFAEVYEKIKKLYK